MGNALFFREACMGRTRNEGWLTTKPAVPGLESVVRFFQPIMWKCVILVYITQENTVGRNEGTCLDEQERKKVELRYGRVSWRKDVGMEQNVVSFKVQSMPLRIIRFQVAAALSCKPSNILGRQPCSREFTGIDDHGRILL